MDSDVIALLGGLLFLLLALVGGGFSIKEISMPTIPAVARAACLVVGVVLVVLSFVPAIGEDPSPVAGDGGTAESAVGVAGVGPTPSAAGGGTGEAVVAEEPDPSVARAHGIEVSGIRATAAETPLAVNDQIRVEYVLRNVGDGPVTFAFTFTGVRTPDDSNADTGEDHQDTVLPPGAELRVSHPVLLDAPGTWKLWPCYEVSDSAGGSGECPDEWNFFLVTVE